MTTKTAIFQSPYLESGEPVRWLRGNHHGHSTLSDGHETPAQLLSAYEQAGYDYLALSEHDRFADPAEYQSATSMCLLPAVEVSSAQGQTLMHLGPPHRCSVDSDADEIRWIVNGGRILKKEPGGGGSLTADELLGADLPEGDLYARAECLGHGAAAAWTQPFWVSRV